MAAPGWYRDPGNARLARWFNGADWTHHTVVMEEWRGRGAPPPPEDRTIVATSRDAYSPASGEQWAAPAGYEEFATYDTQGSYLDEGEPTELGPAVGGPGRYRQPTLGDRFRDTPTWFRVGAPVLVVLILLVAVAAAAGGGGDDDAGTDAEVVRPTDNTSLDVAIDIAYDEGFPRTASEARLGSLIKFACEQIGKDDGVRRTAEQLAKFGFDGSELTGATEGLKAGGAAFCTDAAAAEPRFFRDVAVAAAATAGVTTSTSSTSTTVRSSTTTAKGATTTTKKPTTTTTKKPVGSTTTKPTSTTTSTTPSTTSSTEPEPTSTSSSVVE